MTSPDTMRMIDPETAGRALATRARTDADLSPSEIAEFGAWLLDVMGRLIFVHDDDVVAGELKHLAMRAFDFHELTRHEQNRLGIWVDAELDALRSRDRRAGDRRAGGRRASDAEGYKGAEAAHLDALDTYFAITSTLTEQGCTHGFKPAKTCPQLACTGRRAQVAWDALRAR